MKHNLCDICGLPSGILSQDLFSRLMICIECENRINSLKHQKESATVGEAKVKPQMRVDKYEKQLKLF